MTAKFSSRTIDSIDDLSDRVHKLQGELDVDGTRYAKMLADVSGKLEHIAFLMSQENEDEK